MKCLHQTLIFQKLVSAKFSQTIKKTFLVYISSNLTHKELVKFQIIINPTNFIWRILMMSFKKNLIVFYFLIQNQRIIRIQNFHQKLKTFSVFISYLTFSLLQYYCYLNFMSLKNVFLNLIFPLFLIFIIFANPLYFALIYQSSFYLRYCHYFNPRYYLRNCFQSLIFISYVYFKTFHFHFHSHLILTLMILSFQILT